MLHCIKLPDAVSSQQQQQQYAQCTKVMCLLSCGALFLVTVKTDMNNMCEGSCLSHITSEWAA